MTGVALSAPSPLIALLSLGTLAALLLIAAWRDMGYRRISNRLCSTVALLALPYWLASTADPIGQFGQQAISLAIAAVPLLLLFVLGILGGGDVKLLAALTLWLPPGELLPMLYATALAGGLLGIVMLLAARLRHRSTPSIPYGVAIATGAMLILSGGVAPLLNAG